MDENRITFFGETDARNKRVKFGIKAKDRTRHVYVIGKTGMGKSTMLENMAVQDIMGGEGMCFIDPHGKTAELLLEYVPKERVRDVIYIAPFDTEYPISFNVLESVDPHKRHLVASGLMSTFKKIWEDAWSARMEYILTNTLLALLEAPGSTLLGVNRMLSDKEYRKEVVSYVKDPSVKTFWNKEFASYTERQAAEAVPAIQNKVGQFTANPLIRNMIGQEHSSFDFREAMDRRKIIIINLSKGRIGDENMRLLGGLLVTKIYLAAMSRADVPDRTAKMLPNFYLFVDEFQNFANASFADILSEARKYKLNLTIAHQYIEQMDEIVRPAVFGNVGTMIAFRVGATDAEALEKEFAPVFVLEDLVNLGFAQIYLKLMIDGLSSQPFSATTLPPIPHPDTSYVKEIIDSSREQFARPREEVEAIVMAFHNPVAKPPAPKSPTASSAGATSGVNSTAGAGVVAAGANAVSASGASTTGVGATASSALGAAIGTATSHSSGANPNSSGSVPVKNSASNSSSSPSNNSSANSHAPTPQTSPKPAFVNPFAKIRAESSSSTSSFNSNKQTANAPLNGNVANNPHPNNPAAGNSSSYSNNSAPVNSSLVPPSSPANVASASSSANSFSNNKQNGSNTKPSFERPRTATSMPSINSHHAQTEPMKPVSLQSLAAKQASKTDPKIPTQKNISDLRSALSAALGKAKLETAENAPKNEAMPVQKPAASIASQTPLQGSVSKNNVATPAVANTASVSASPVIAQDSKPAPSSTLGKVESAVQTPWSESNSTSSAPATGRIEQVASAPPPQATIVSEFLMPQPREVPEDLLKRVLKGD